MGELVCPSSGVGDNTLLEVFTVEKDAAVAQGPHLNHFLFLTRTEFDKVAVVFEPFREFLVLLEGCKGIGGAYVEVSTKRVGLFFIVRGKIGQHFVIISGLNLLNIG